MYIYTYISPLSSAFDSRPRLSVLTYRSLAHVSPMHPHVTHMLHHVIPMSAPCYYHVVDGSPKPGPPASASINSKIPGMLSKAARASTQSLKGGRYATCSSLDPQP